MNFQSKAQAVLELYVSPVSESSAARISSLFSFRVEATFGDNLAGFDVGRDHRSLDH